MIILFNPRATKPRNVRLPLAILALAAVLEGREEYEIIDGNLDDNATETILSLIQNHKVEMLGVTVMPGPQMAAAVESCREIRRLRPEIPIVWGGYFPSLYPEASLNAHYVDYVVRGQGEETLLELLEAIRGQRSLSSIRGISYTGERQISEESGARIQGTRCISVESVPSPARGALYAPFLLWKTYGRTSRQHRLSVSVQLLRSACRIRESRAHGESGADRGDSRTSRQRVPC